MNVFVLLTNVEQPEDEEDHLKIYLKDLIKFIINSLQYKNF